MIDIRQISPELAAKAHNELNEVESRIPEDIAALRAWIDMQPHLNANTNDQFLLNFLRGSKFSIEKAKQKLDFFYTIKSLTPDIFIIKTITDKDLKMARLGTFIPLPKPLKPDGPRIHISRFGQLDLGQFQIVDLCKHQVRVLDIELHEDDNSIIGGIVNVIDMSNMSLKFFLQFEPSLMIKFGVYSEKALPLRVKGMHVINLPKEALTLMNISQKIMGKKLQDRMIIHPTLESLYEHVPKMYLPAEYGGENGRLQDYIDDWEQRISEHKEFFEENSQYGVDEKLRVGTKVTTESLFGLDGTFRKLEID